MSSITGAIDALNEKVGFYASYLVLPLLAIVGWEVLMRYAFNAPTSWAFEMTVFLYGVNYSLTLGYAHKNDTHVAIDVFEARLAPRPRAILRIIANLVIFIPTIGLLAWYSCDLAAISWEQRELASSSWAPAIYPYKTLMAIGFVLFFLQGIAKLLKDFRSLKNPS